MFSKHDSNTQYTPTQPMLYSRDLVSMESQLSGIPGLLLNPIHSSILSEYIRRFKILPEGMFQYR